MDFKALLSVTERLVESTGSGVLATIDEDGWPDQRWMTFGLIEGQPGRIFSVTRSESSAARQIRSNSAVGLVVQTRPLDEIVTVSGVAVVNDAPAVVSTALEALRERLVQFWTRNTDASDLVVIETTVRKLSYVRSAQDERYTALAE